MVTLKRVVMLAIASVLIAAVVQVDRVYADDPGQGRGGDRNRRRGGDSRQKPWGSGPIPRTGVCFYDNKDFRGKYFCVEPGDDWAQLPPGMGDKISSVRVIDNVEVIVFRDARFNGPSGRFLSDVRDLRKEGWNDRISSLRVTNASVAWDRNRLPAWGREQTPSEGACFYQDIDFRGDYFCVPRGASYATVPRGFDDKISSIRIISAGGVLISVDREFDGSRRRVTSDVADLRRAGWNDKISSIRVF